jgi:pilus assembly protein CpaE
LTSPAPRILVLDRTGELAARLRHNVVAAGAVVKACPDAGRAEALLAGGTWDVVVAGPSLMHRGGLRRLASLHERYPEVAVLLAVQERPRADIAEIVQVGASDLLPLHDQDDDLRRTLVRAMRITRARLGIMAAGSGGQNSQAGRGRVVMVASASGGCGKTFLATNAAGFLARATDLPVVLFDLDLQFGEVSTALRLRPHATIIDALAAEASGDDLEETLDDFLVAHPDGFKVLAAPRQPEEADSVTPGDVARIFDVLRARRAWVVIDTHEGLSDLFSAALEATDHVIAVATPDRPSQVNLTRYLGALERLGMASANVSVVLNKVEPDSDVNDASVAIPYSREVPRSINVGVPILVGNPKSVISALLTTVLAAVLSAPPKAAPETVEPVEDEVDLRVVEPAVEGALTSETPPEIDLRTVAESPLCRGRAPPRTFSPRSHPSLVPSLVIK